jgi:hypothetical protein
MFVSLYFFYAFLASAALNLICSILVLRGMAATGIKVSFFEIRWQVHKNLKAYRQSTLERTGKGAWPYYGYQGSLAGMIGFGVLIFVSLGQ